MKCVIENTELSSREGTRHQFNGGKAVIKLGIDVNREFYVVVEQEGGSNPKPPQRFRKEAFLHWAARVSKRGSQVHAVSTGSASNWSKLTNCYAVVTESSQSYSIQEYDSP